MTTLTISLPEALKALLEEQAVRGGYANVGDYLRDVIKMIRDRKRQRAELDEKLLEGLQSPMKRMTAKTWQKLEKRISQRDAKQDQE